MQITNQRFKLVEACSSSSAKNGSFSLLALPALSSSSYFLLAAYNRPLVGCSREGGVFSPHRMCMQVVPLSPIPGFSPPFPPRNPTSIHDCPSIKRARQMQRARVDGCWWQRTNRYQPHQRVSSSVSRYLQSTHRISINERQAFLSCRTKFLFSFGF